MTLKSLWPHFGGKSSIAAEVWERFGDVPNLVEPFCGTAAVLLARPDAHEWWERTETVNDLDGFIANYWRATKADPEAVARWADWPINENDLHARHAWLVARKADLQAKLEGVPDLYDAKVAGWWLWGMCIWIGSGWCSGKGPWRVVDGRLERPGDGEEGQRRKLPHLGSGMGINRQLPHLGDAGKGINRKRPRLGGWSGVGVEALPPGLSGGSGVCDTWSEHLRETMQALSDRLRRVRVCCGDWTRVCGPTPTYHHGLTGVFLDAPYAQEERDPTLYTVETNVSRAVREWAIEQGENSLMRIALCGYDGEHQMPDSWECVEWKSKGGYGSQGDGAGRENAARERVWFSPHCLKVDRPVQATMWA